MAADEQRIQALEAENERLRRRVAELEPLKAQYAALQQDLRTIFDSVNDAFFIHTLDETGTILDVNQRMLDMYRIDCETALQYTVADFSSAANDMEEIGHVLNRAAAGETPAFTWRARRPVDGSEFDAYVTLKRITYQQQPCILAIVQDTSEQLRTEEALKRSEERLRSIIEKIPAGLCITNEQQLFEYVNPAYCQIYGYTPQELIDQPFTVVVPPENRPMMQDLHNRFMYDETEIRGEWQVLNKDGQPLTILADAAYIIDTDGKPKKVTFVIDITERKRAENELAIYKTVIENAPDGISVANLDGVMTYNNKAINTIAGYADSLVGHAFQELYFEEDQALISELTQQLFDEGVGQTMLRWKQQNGSAVPVHVTAFVIYDSQGAPQVVASIVRDVSDEQRAEAERAHLQAQVIEAQQAALRELSTPLIPLSNNVVLMPLIGSIDTMRAQMVMEALLEGVAAYQAEIALLDITGVQVVDTQVANALIHAAQAVRLLGARVILTGIGAPMAQTLVHLGVNLSDLMTMGSLQMGVAYALEYTNEKQK